MLELFRRNQIQYYIFVLLYVILVSVPFLIQTSGPFEHKGGYLYGSLLPFINDYTIVSKALGFIILMTQVVFLNRMANLHNLTIKTSLMPGVFYALFLNYYPEFITFIPEAIANLFVIFSLINLMDMDIRKRKAHKIINASFWIALASLFYPICILYLIVMVIIMQLLTNVKIKDLLFMLFGSIMPYYAYGTFVYLNSGSEGIKALMSQNIEIFSFDYSWLSDPMTILKISIFAIILLLVVGSMGSVTRSLHVQFRKKLNAVYIILIGSIVIAAFGAETGISNLTLLFPTLSILLTAGILRLENTQFAEIIHFILLAGFIIFQFVLPNYNL